MIKTVTHRSFSRIIFTLLLAVSFSGYSYARTNLDKLESILSQPIRPTIKEFLSTLGSLPKENPYDDHMGLEEGQNDEILKKFPEFIASLEYYFPGYTLATLGRDAQFIGAVVEAFYLSVGQDQRVEYIGVSGPSFQSMTQNTAEALLRQAGLTGDSKQKGPVLLIDRTSYSGGSQSTNMIRFGYHFLNSKGVTNGAPSKYLNILSTSYSEELVGNSSSKQNFIKKINARVNPNGIPTQPIGVSSSMSSFTDQGPLWHQGFGSIVNLGKRVTGQPGPLDAEQNRRIVLSRFYEVVKLVSSPKFLKRVKSAAEALGYEFPTSQTALSVILKPKPPAKPQPLSKLIKSLNQVGEQNGRYTDNGLLVHQWLEEQIAYLQHLISENKENKKAINDTLIDFIEQVFKARSQGDGTALLGSRDVRRLLGFSLGEASPANKTFEKNVAQIVSSDPYYLKVWRTKGPSITSEKNSNSPLEEIYQNISSLLPDSDQCEGTFR